MENLTEILFSQVNIILTVLLMLLVLYWLVTMISGIDFDLDIDVDIDVDIDADVDIDIEGGIEGGNMDFQDISSTEVNKDDIIGKRQKKLKWWQIVLIYFNFVGLPFMFTFTCWIFIWWFSTVTTTVLTHSYNNSLGFIIFLGAILPSLILTKVFTTPFKKFFTNLNKDGDKPADFIGRIAESQSTILDDKMGTAVVVIDGVSMTIYIKSLTKEKISYQQKILIIKQSTDKNYYLVQNYNN